MKVVFYAASACILLFVLDVVSYHPDGNHKVVVASKPIFLEEGYEKAWDEDKKTFIEMHYMVNFLMIAQTRSTDTDRASILMIIESFSIHTCIRRESIKPINTHWQNQ